MYAADLSGRRMGVAPPLALQIWNVKESGKCSWVFRENVFHSKSKQISVDRANRGAENVWNLTIIYVCEFNVWNWTIVTWNF